MKLDVQDEVVIRLQAWLRFRYRKCAHLRRERDAASMARAARAA